MARNFLIHENVKIGKSPIIEDFAIIETSEGS